MDASAPREAEVLIIGGGPAGAATAFHLAAAGRRVILLEAGQPGEGKPCGGGMAASVQQWFPFSLAPAVDQVIRRVRFTWCLDDPVTAVLPGDAPFWIVRRSRLDSFLLHQAVEAGCQLCHGARVERLERQGRLWQLQDSNGQRFSAPALVIADGSDSRFAGPLRLGPARPRFANTLSVEVEADVAEPDMGRFEFGLVHHGFCWTFPRQGGYSIGVGTFVGREESDVEPVLAAVLPSLGLPADAGVRQQRRLRLWDGHHPLHAEGVVVVGDAASLCDAFLAEGLRPALLSGCRAAAALDQWLEGDAGALAGYSTVMRQQWGESMAWGRRIARVFYRFPQVGYQLGIKRPTAPERIAQILSGEYGYGDIAQRAIRRLLFQSG
ncbi:MAG: geranylgeranyl reductase family protein [Synechococcaceae cyanobacterium]|nr:geranylgeranyl reductase family protein [Synechococcaceae cyanobacterium]